jgi:hypothetical protein
MCTMTWVTITCDGTTAKGVPCRAEDPWGGLSPKQARMRARMHGWIRRNQTMDLCPLCRSEGF